MNPAANLKDFPEIPARLSECGKLLIIDRCPFCGRTHCHGASYGHRWAHCLTAMGEKQHGYILIKAEGQTAPNRPRRRLKLAQTPKCRDEGPGLIFT